MKICLIDAGIFVEKPELLKPLEELGSVQVFDGIPKSLQEVVERAGDAEVIAFGLMQFTNEMLDNLPKLKILQFIGTGVWNFVDVEYAESKGIKVANIDGYGSNAVAEYAVAVTMALARKITKADQVIKSRQWTIDGLKGKEIAGSIIGVVGTGNIGKLVAQKFYALGAKVIACDLYENVELKEKYDVEYKSIEELFMQSDIITLHMKATKENENIIDRKLLEITKEDVLLVNVARAELVNTEDLYKVLLAGRIGGAAVDVYDSEPPRPKDWLLGNLQNVIATPHMAYYTQEANDNSIKMMVSSILASQKG